MEVSFCNQCGERLKAGARFCAGCGASVQALPDTPGMMRGSGVPLPELEPLGSGLLRDRAPREEQVAPWGLTTRDLDHFVAGSLPNAVMDTCLLLVRDASGSSVWVPISKIGSMEGLSIVAAAMTVYHVGEEAVEPFCLPEFLRDETAGDLFGAFLEAILEKPFVILNITVQFRPVDYGNQAAEITGHWATVTNDQGVNDIRAILQMPFPGKVLKKRLSEHEAVLKQLAEEAAQQGSGSEEAQTAAELFNEILRNLRTVISRMPDGKVDHIHCVASVTEGEAGQPTVQADLAPAERRKPARLDLNRRVARVLRSRSAVLLKSRPPKIAAAGSIRSSLLQDIRRELKRDAGGRVRGDLRADR